MGLCQNSISVFTSLPQRITEHTVGDNIHWPFLHVKYNNPIHLVHITFCDSKCLTHFKTSIPMCPCNICLGFYCGNFGPPS